MARPRKSSACVTLVLIGAAALTGCGDTGTANRRTQYATKEECLADWGDPAECEQQAAPRAGGSTGSSGGHYYWGPSHSSPSRSGSSSSSSSGHSISRGGFGSHGSSSS